ncbi:MAG: hypothetical protein HY865_14500 [Chloroflexi bacterium]|nr:hypothetical protein [Chloroflexota bacterium]
MSKNQLAGRFILYGGIVELLVAALHFIMPFSIGQAAEINKLPIDYRNYVFHATIAVGLCMMCFGMLSIYFSRKASHGDKNAWVFAMSQAALWTTRAISELILPIKVPLFFLSNPTTVILPMVIVIVLLFLVPNVILWPGKREKE